MPTPKNPVCLITGGSSGIGLATAKRFAGEGYHIAICGRRDSALQDAHQQIVDAGTPTIQCFTQSVDLNETDQALALGSNVIQHFGRIDVLVNNAGAAPLGPFEELTPAAFEQSLNTNVRSVFYLTQLVWKSWLSQNEPADVSDQPPQSPQGRGVVVNISSLAAVDPFPGFSLYGATKAWLELLTLALAAEGQPHNVRICALRPGAVETPLLRRLFPDFPSDQCVSPDQVAETVWNCVNQPNQFPSGQSFPVTNQK